MRLHMVMDCAAREALHGSGRLAGCRVRIADESSEPAYRWLAERMLERLPAPPAGVEAWPLWAWRRRNGRSKPRLHAREYVRTGGLWLVSLDVPDDLVLLSDFDAWHHVLNGWYLPDERSPDGGRSEDEAFEAGLEAAGLDWAARPYPEPFGSRVLESWERIFDIRGLANVQATVWCVDADMVVAEARVPTLAELRARTRPAGLPFAENQPILSA